MDGLPGMQRGLIAAKRENIAPIKKMVGPLTPTRYRDTRPGHELDRVILVAVLSFLLGALLALYGPFLTESLQGALPNDSKAMLPRFSSLL